MTPAMGHLAPTFDLVDQHGKSHKLEAYRGQWVVLFFYPKDHTPGCTKEACQFRDLYAEFNQLSTQVLGISLDSSESHQAFATQHGLTFPLLADIHGQTAKAYGVLGRFLWWRFAKRQTFVIDPQGFVRLHNKHVNPTTHTKALIKQLSHMIKS